MTESEAHIVLGVASTTNSEDILEAYEEAVFEQASFFMRRVFIPKLALARIKKLERIALASNVVGLRANEVLSTPSSFDFSSATNQEEVLERYNLEETQIKLKLANTSSAAQAIELFTSWIQLFEAYAKSFLSFCNLNINENQVKLTEAPIFVEYKNASDSERLSLIGKECARLAKLLD